MIQTIRKAWGIPELRKKIVFTLLILLIFPLLTAALYLARFDFTSGASRLLYASLITLAAALGA